MAEVVAFIAGYTALMTGLDALLDNLHYGRKLGKHKSIWKFI
jgi:hypothetical protein